MKIVLAPDSFKNAATASQVAHAMSEGLKSGLPHVETVELPMADGGEGTAAALVAATHGRWQTARVLNPLGNTITARYGVLGDGQTAVIEMAAASGIELITAEEREPLRTTTYGTGQLIKVALLNGARKIIVGLGGSATNDGGAGMAQALGVRLLDAQQQALALGGGALSQLAHIDMTDVLPELATAELILASDVVNPLLGPTGATAVFGPQKGASPATVTTLERNLAHFATVIRHDCHQDLASIPGSGAAGGLGFGLLTFTPAHLQPGIELVVEQTHLKQLVSDADVVITGEGSIDFQTQYGKTPMGVAQAVKLVNPTALVIALAGKVGPGLAVLYPKGIDVVLGISAGETDLTTALANTTQNVTRTCENIGHFLRQTSR